MSFFITSAGSGKGADLGGLAGADAHCQRLATAASPSGKTWRAYLSTSPTLPSGATPGVAAVNARDRIGAGPRFNAKRTLIALTSDTQRQQPRQGDGARVARQCCQGLGRQALEKKPEAA